MFRARRRGSLLGKRQLNGSTETGRQRQLRALLQIGIRLDFHHFHAGRRPRLRATRQDFPRAVGSRCAHRLRTHADTWASKCPARARSGVRSKD